MTRGALTTFSIANDVAKYFAIIPAMFAAFYPQLAVLNVMGLHNPESAILSAIIFNALIIVALIPLSLKGVAYRPAGAASILRRNLLIYGIGGIIVPFIGIKLIDVIDRQQSHRCDRHGDRAGLMQFFNVIARSEATKQSRSTDGAPGLLRFARNDGKGEIE
jgi:hypothetical protein